MSDPAGAQHPSPHARRHMLLAIVSLGMIVAGVHGRSIVHGFFMDDHAHVRQLRECGWSLSELVGACRLELVGGAAEVWFLPDCTLRFFRPVAFGAMKLVYTLFGWSPVAAHVASLLYHWLACVLLMLLCREIVGQKRIGWGVAAMFALHPGHVGTVQWIASQTELLVTLFLLGATLCYGQARGWFALGGSRCGSPARALRWHIAAIALFIPALGCRENAAAWPLLIAIVELARRDSSWRTIALRLAPSFVLVAAYIALRTAMLGAQGVPPKPYVYSPGDAEFARFVFDKACYYLLGEFLCVPCIPFAGVNYFRQIPLIFYGLTALVLLFIVLAVLSQRRSLGAVLGPAWLGLMMLPVLPVFEAPHHLYLPGVGWAILVALPLKFLSDRLPTARDWRRWTCEGAVWLVGTAIAFGMGFLCYFGGLAMDSAQRVEDRVVEEIVRSPRPLHDGDTIYIANLPIIAHYVKYMVEARTGLRDLRVSILTWSPRVLGVVTPVELSWATPTTCEFSIACDRYFDGPLGALVRSAGQADIFTRVGEPIRERDLTVTVLELQEGAVSRIRFELPQPLGEHVHFFWGSAVRWAFQIPPETTR